MVGRRRRVATAAALAAMAIGMTAAAAPARAAAPEPAATLSIEPAGPYLDDQRVTVTATGLAPSTKYTLLECTVDGCVGRAFYDGSERPGSDPFPRDPPKQWARYVTTDATGAITREIDLLRSVPIGDATVDCSAVACDLVAVRDDGGSRDAATPLSFAATGTYVWPQAHLDLASQTVGASGTVRLTASGLDHWRIDLWGFVPWRWVTGAEPEVCADGNQAPAEDRCQAIEEVQPYDELRWPQVAVDGTAADSVRVPSTITAGGQPWDCRQQPCSLRLVQPKVATNEVRLVFDRWAPWDSARQMVDELSHLVGGDLVPEPVRADLAAALEADTTTVVDALGQIARHDRPAGDVATLYAALLKRRPDLAGLEYWVPRLRAGTVSAGRVADTFANTPEVRGRYAGLFPYEVVEKAYEEILGRPSDQAGYTYWMGRLAAGLPLYRMLSMFTLSAEARANTTEKRVFTVALLGLLDREMTSVEHLRTHGGGWLPELLRSLIDETPVFDVGRTVDG